MIKINDNQKKVSKDKFMNDEITVNEGKILPICCHCAQVPQKGLYDGFRLNGKFFCSDCQKKLFKAEQCSEEYQKFLSLIRKTFFSRFRD